jgi:four helix bundle protein
VLSWQKSKYLYIELQTEFGTYSNYSFKDQLFRACLSISNNIAEGFDRGTDKELRQFLIISRGSCAEVRSMLHIALEIGVLSSERHKELTQITTTISKLLTGFIKKLETGDKRPVTK